MSEGLIVLRADDAKCVAALEAASVEHPSDEARWQEALKQTQRLVLGLDTPDGDLVAAVSASLTMEMADIEDVFVRPGDRRRGLASFLIQALAKRAGERGIARLTLDVSEHNGAALALYRGLGFVEDGRRKRYYSDRCDAILMSRTVSPFAGQGAPVSP